MSSLELSADVSTIRANRAGVYLAVLQLVFTLGWTTYVIYLTKLAAQVGIAPSAVILILMLDQAIFTITDTAMGIAADKIAPFVGRLGLFVGALTALSCAAFVALPFVAGTGPVAQAWFIALIVIWAITSSALRAPPLTLLGKHRAKPSVPFLSALAMLGYGLAGAVSPYLGVVLRDQDARLPFVISSVVLLVTALALSVLGAELAGNLNTVIVAQFLAGAAWGCMLMSAISAALAIGDSGAEGKVVGLVFSALALATFARMAAVAGGLQKLPEYAPLLHWAPVACWSVAGAGLLVIAASRAQRGLMVRRGFVVFVRGIEGHRGACISIGALA